MTQISKDSSRDFQGIWIPAALWNNRTMSMTQKVILLEVRSFQRNGMPCFVSNEHLAALCNVSSSAIEKALRSLVQMGHLKRWTDYDGKKRSRLMTVLHPDMWDDPQQTADTTRNQLSTPPATNCGDTPQSVEVTTRSQVRNNNTREQNKEQTKRKEATPQSIEHVTEYFRAVLLVADPQSMAEDFWNYYESNGWHVGKNKMRSWHAAASQWNKRQKQYNEQRTTKGRGYNRVNSADLANAIRNQTS